MRRRARRRRERGSADDGYRRHRRYYKTTVPGAGYERWEVDSGEDAPLEARDLRVILLWALAMLVFAAVVAGLVTYL